MHKPAWFSDEHVMVSTAPTCGLSKGGRLLRKVDPITAKRVQDLDPETGASIDSINDQLLEDMEALVAIGDPRQGLSPHLPDTLTFAPAHSVSLSCAVPAYYDRRYHVKFAEGMRAPEFAGFSTATIGELIESGKLIVRGGHGSPSQEQRIGEVPYIKVSDLRAGLVNINPTNRVPLQIAEQFWRGKISGLLPFDLMCPERTSKNIGDFCVLMPGQEQVLTTKEIIVLRAGPKANFDQFYLLWAMTLKIVRAQWKRVVFMQTNREDVGKRYLEIEVPVPPTAARANEVSQAFRDYFTRVSEARTELETYLCRRKDHHFFVAAAESSVEDPTVEAG